jgi:hypothetical protein
LAPKDLLAKGDLEETRNVDKEGGHSTYDEGCGNDILLYWIVKRKMTYGGVMSPPNIANAC